MTGSGLGGIDGGLDTASHASHRRGLARQGCRQGANATRVLCHPHAACSSPRHSASVAGPYRKAATMAFSIDDLTEAVTGNGVGIRAKTRLEPLGGPGDKLAPPTYGDGPDPETKYALEERMVDGERLSAVVLDSVASQANRFEEALLYAVRDGEITIPLVTVDFSGAEGLEGLDSISALEAPHRVYDAILRDSMLGDRLFRLSEVGQAITEATVRNAAALFHYSPTTLLFGGWDSTGPKGGRGSKFERAITSEIVGIDIARGVKSASRIDPLGIELKAGPVFETPDGGWTLDESEALTEKGKPVAYRGSGDGGAGRPSQINHGNIAPSLDRKAGGVTVDRIEATTVVSLIQLRRLRFPADASGQPLAGANRTEAEAAARTALAALGLAATVLAFENGMDLRSRCVLTATDDLRFELVRRGSADNTEFTMTRDEATRLLADAAERAAGAGIGWATEEVVLQPVDRLVELVRRSQVIAAKESGGE